MLNLPDDGPGLEMIALIEVPLLVGAVLAFFIGRFAGRYAYLRGESFVRSYIFAFFVFLVSNTILLPVVPFIASLFLGEGGGGLLVMYMVMGSYTFWIQWAVKLVVAVLYFFSLRKFISLQATVTAVVPKPMILRAIPIFGLLIILLVINSVGEVYYANQRMKEREIREEEARIETEKIVEEQSTEIRNALRKFYEVYGVYPEKLADLVPEYLTRVPTNSKVEEYDVNDDETDYRLCALTYDGKKCITSKTEWSPVRPYCSDSQRGVVGVECQLGRDREHISF